MFQYKRCQNFGLNSEAVGEVCAAEVGRPLVASGVVDSPTVVVEEGIQTVVAEEGIQTVAEVASVVDVGMAIPEGEVVQ